MYLIFTSRKEVLDFLNIKQRSREKISELLLNEG